MNINNLSIEDDQPAITSEFINLQLRKLSCFLMHWGKFQKVKVQPYYYDLMTSYIVTDFSQGPSQIDIDKELSENSSREKNLKSSIKAIL